MPVVIGVISVASICAIIIKCNPVLWYDGFIWIPVLIFIY